MSIVKIEVKKCLHKMPESFYTRSLHLADAEYCSFVTKYEGQWYLSEMKRKSHQVAFYTISECEISEEAAIEIWQFES